MSDSPTAESGAARGTAQDTIRAGRAHLGLELGSTRIKAVLIDGRGDVLASGSHAWENRLVDGIWTYSLDEVWEGVQAAWADVASDVRARYGLPLERLGGLGISAMMHGYLAFDESGDLLVPFRTWRNTGTGDASALLGEALGVNIPLRWSIAHLVHAALAEEEHVARIDHITTLAGYVHERLSGRSVLGVGDASGVFPIGADGRSYDVRLLEIVEALPVAARLPKPVAEMLPDVLVAGERAGELTPEGALLLDPSGTLTAGAVMAPPEGDAGTGMVATNSVRPRTGNVSAGTSAFAMVVLEKPLGTAREEIDVVTTPWGDPVAMIHTNNCTGDLDQWVGLFESFASLLHAPVERGDLYRILLTQAMTAPADADGIISYNYLSGEHQTGISSGRPLVVRGEGARLTLPAFMRAHLYGAFGALAVGMRTLIGEEGVGLDRLYAHGGIFTTAGIAQQVLADALDVPVTVTDSAGEGGAWGMAVLAAYTALGSGGGELVPLGEHLARDVFAEVHETTLEPDPDGVEGFAAWLERYVDGLQVERLAGDVLA